MRCYLGAVKWKKGVVRDQLGPLCYYVEVAGRKWKHHVDQLKSSLECTENADTDIGVQPPLGHLPSDLFSRNINTDTRTVQPPVSTPVSSPQMDELPSQVESLPAGCTSQTVSTPSITVATTPGPRHSNRVCKPLKHLDV